jgi:HlyD family secretion protein
MTTTSDDTAAVRAHRTDAASPVRRKGLMKALRWLAVLAVLGGGAAAAFRYSAAERKPKIHYESVPLERGPISARVTASGTLSALVTVLVGSQVSGRIETIGVDFNSPVKKGQIVATIEPSLFKAAVEQARANYVSAKATLDKSKAQAIDADRQYKRSETLVAQKLIAQADFETAEANASVAKAQVSASEAMVAQARAALNQADVNFRYTTISSPIDGVVISRSVDVGQTVAASLQAPTLFTIAQDLTKMQVDTSVAEGDVGKIQPGMKVSFVVDAYPTERFEGTVRQVRDAPTTVQNVVTYDGVIDVDNSRKLLKPGMTANVTFVYAQKDSVLHVPNAALRFKPDSTMLEHMGARGGAPVGLKPNERFIWILKGDKPDRQAVGIGITDGSQTEVTSGNVREGDHAITEVLGAPPASTVRPF